MRERESERERARARERERERFLNRGQSQEHRPENGAGN